VEPAHLREEHKTSFLGHSGHASWRVRPFLRQERPVLRVHRVGRCGRRAKRGTRTGACTALRGSDREHGSRAAIRAYRTTVSLRVSA
jgi:hypothetical protein